MTVDQKRARWFGVLCLITFVTSIPALALYETGEAEESQPGTVPAPALA